ncbi:hypothetical protein E2C01_099454 [Portunus trituberculatus]|uniref:Uncharacterized protein n=1 Tax=Portunus trituberculatus TaxID=210409 RepID=A0A5B7K9N6_PORTR|nr:hypothetical protein [Portunus trituberculatus]
MWTKLVSKLKDITSTTRKRDTLKYPLPSRKLRIRWTSLGKVFKALRDELKETKDTQEGLQEAEVKEKDS